MRRQERKYKNTIIAIIVLVVAVCALWLVMLAVYGEERDTAAASEASGGASGGEPNGADTEGQAEAPAGPGDAEGVAEANEGPEMPPFYDESRSERYADFAALRPELAFDDVVWMVNVNLDLTPYDDAVETANPESLTVLVNKFFYLPDGFTPPDLTPIGQSMLRGEAATAMHEMISDASEEGYTLWVQSGYRSFSVQSGLYSQYSARDGAEAADTYSARPGHSEHQLGLAADLNTITDAFGFTGEGIWTAENCWKYGFIVRYTEENTGITLYKPEPWHVRYIGRDAAGAMRDRGIQSFEEYWARHIAS